MRPQGEDRVAASTSLASLSHEGSAPSKLKRRPPMPGRRRTGSHIGNGRDTCCGMLASDDLPYVVPLQGGSNFRDLGGYRTADGRKVRRGAVFRSAHLGGLTDTDRAALGRLGV